MNRALLVSFVAATVVACGGGGADNKVNAPSSGGADTPAAGGGGDSSSSGSGSGGSASSGGGGGGSSTASAGGEKDTGGGGAASDFSAKTVNGAGTVSLASLKGKVVIVDFWATWCEPCKKSFPKLQGLYLKYKASGLEIVGVSVDDEAGGIKGFASTYGAKFPIVWDDGKKIAGKWKPESMPSTYILDKDGKIRHVHKGYHDGEETEIEAEIKKLL